MDPMIWRAIAGPCSEFPTVNSRVYYFPQGNMEQASPPYQNLSDLTPCILCTVLDVQLLANPTTHEFYAKLMLQPIRHNHTAIPTPFTNLFLPPLPNPSVAIAPYRGDHDMLTFSKELSPLEVSPFLPRPPISTPPPEPSAVFFVPDFVANCIFPPTDILGDWQEQDIRVSDIFGREWRFRHCYNHHGGAMKHTILNGLAEFATQMKLNAGDFVVFMRKKSLPGEIFIAIRRATKWKLQSHLVEKAAAWASRNWAFWVWYYPSPRTGWSDCVVRAEIVEEAMRSTLSKLESVNGMVGMRVMMPLEGSTSSLP